MDIGSTSCDPGNRPTESSRLAESSRLSRLLHFCPLCDKPFTKESSRNRHRRYCGSRTPSRPRSCRACNTSKVKCSFEKPCLRCTKRGVPCVYDEPATPKAGLSSPVHHHPDEPKVYSAETSPSVQGTSTGGAPTVSTDSTDAEPITTALEPWHARAGVDNSDAFVELVGSEPYLFQDTFSPFDGPPLFDDFVWDHPGCSATAPAVVAQGELLHVNQASGWCTWTQRGLSFAVDSDTPLAKTVSSHARPEAQRSADLVIQALRAFPVMMRRRETLPWFIHPHANVSTESAQSDLPDAISTCMGIAQMLASSTQETKPFLWRTIGAECTRLAHEMPQMSPFENLAAQQACMVYLIMCIVDYSSINAGYGQELTRILFNFCVTFKGMFGGHGSESESANPSLCWEDWIFAESRRRMTILWLLIGCAACVKTGGVCDSSGSTRNMPLPGPKSVWEATSQASWETEYAASRMLQVDGLVTVGDLIDTQNSASRNPANARKLDCWNAGVDNVGSLANLIGSMV